ncbi:MAG: hypothetical protein WAL61_01055 [Acidimicrobiales bacterium]
MAFPLAGTLGAVALASCGSSPAQKSSSPPKVVRTTTTTGAEITTPTVTINGHTYQVPTESGSQPIHQIDDSGQQIILTSNGVLPQQLFSTVSTPVTWTNLTDKTLTLTLVDTGLPPKQILPGGSFTWTPNVLDFGYTVSDGDKGGVNVGSFNQ